VSIFDAVLFDWSGTLVHDPRPADRLRRASEIVGRETSIDTVGAILAALDVARVMPEVEAALRDEDTSAERHRTGNMSSFERAGLDLELAEALYAFDSDADNRPLYHDAAETLAGFIDACVLSFEHGCQKPDPRMFLTALELLDVAADHALMVGDRASHDGGAANVGIATFILPPPPAVVGARGLDAVTRLVGIG
jgi:FMN phosphatase YigB (HAD superfamily)